MTNMFSKGDKWAAWTSFWIAIGLYVVWLFSGDLKLEVGFFGCLILARIEFAAFRIEELHRRSEP